MSEKIIYHFKRGGIGFSACKNCGSDDLSPRVFLYSGGTIEKDMRCNHCEFEWVAVIEEIKTPVSTALKEEIFGWFSPEALNDYYCYLKIIVLIFLATAIVVYAINTDEGNAFAAIGGLVCATVFGIIYYQIFLKKHNKD